MSTDNDHSDTYGPELAENADQSQRPAARPATLDDNAGTEEGREAANPFAIPPRGWRDIASRVRHQFATDHVTLTSAGVAFFGFTALVPMLAAGIAIYGLVADESDVLAVGDRLDGAMPPQVADMITQQLEAVVGASPNTLGFAAVIGIAAALWTASSAVAHLIETVNIAYDEDDDDRSFWQKRGSALVFTAGLLALFAASGFVIVVGSRLGTGFIGSLLSMVAWIVAGGFFVIALATLYRHGPDRASAKWRWVSPGAVLAVVTGVIMSAVFRYYVVNFGGYNETYGSLGAVIVLLLWLYLTAMAVIVGAEVNAEIEHQTLVDSTTGEPQAMGHRNAEMADTIGRADL
jgi:membrane protein